MSITLVTGTPGSGKTLYTVDYIARQLKSGRRLMVDGIRDLAIEHVDVDEPWLRRWHELAAHNDLIVIDEAQRIYPPTSISQKVSIDIEQLHVHRHKGVDFILITQHPQRISKTVRDLVGRHVHVRRLFGMKRAMLYEWDHCHNISSLAGAVKTMWSFPASVFKLYTSAEVHTKQKGVIPKALFIAPVALVIAIVLAYRAFVGVNSGFGSKKPVSVNHVVAGSNGAGEGGGVAGAGGSVTWHVVGRYMVDADAYVVLADGSGVLRVERPDGFQGGGIHTAGPVDGANTASWTGKAPSANGVK